MKHLDEYIAETIMYSSIFEMAEKQKECEQTVKSQCANIIENLFLIKYFRISGLYSRDIQHWKHELAIAIYNAGKFEVKKNDSYNRRRRIIDRVFNAKSMTDPERIERMLQVKLHDEADVQYKTNPHAQEWIGETIASMINDIPDIKELINQWNYEDILNFVNNL